MEDNRKYRLIPKDEISKSDNPFTPSDYLDVEEKHFYDSLSNNIADLAKKEKRQLLFYFTGFAWGFILAACIGVLVILNLK